jgi:serine/threonine protein kinase
MVLRTAPVWARPEMFVLFLISTLTIIRAAMVPSTARRSAWVTAVAQAPLLVSTYLYYLAHPRPAPMPSALGFTLSAAALSSCTVIVTATVSRTVHRLRERVREAMQLGQYTLDRKIGEGGMGVVWKARHAMLRRPTAIKLLPPGRAGEHNLARFEREVQLTSVLTHPNTVAIYDYGRTPEGVFYYAMEYLEGLDLQTLVEKDGPQEPGRVIHLLLQICGALEEAHGLGLVHRDVKPANILLCERPGSPDLVKVLDFGLVKQLEGTGAIDVGRSMAGEVVGTPHYLSPEAVVTPGSVDARSDLYAVGGVAYFLLTGATPFSGRTLVEICGHHLHSAVIPPSQRLGRPVPAALEATVLSCLAKSPDQRPRDAAALRDLLAAAATDHPWSREAAATWWRDKGLLLRAELPAPASDAEGLTVVRARS